MGTTTTSPTRKRYVTVPAAARHLGVSRTTMHALLDDGAIPYTQPSKHRRVLLADVDAYRASREHGRKAWVAQVEGDDPLLD